MVCIDSTVREEQSDIAVYVAIDVNMVSLFFPYTWTGGIWHKEHIFLPPGIYLYLFWSDEQMPVTVDYCFFLLKLSLWSVEKSGFLWFSSRDVQVRRYTTISNFTCPKIVDSWTQGFIDLYTLLSELWSFRVGLASVMSGRWLQFQSQWDLYSLRLLPAEQWILIKSSAILKFDVT